MRIGILGTGMVGRALGETFAKIGHDVMLGGRTEEPARDWTEETGLGRAGNFEAAARHAEIAILAVRGDIARSVVADRVGRALAGKVLIDVSNPLDFSDGFPPKLTAGMCNDTSVGETLQADLPETQVVKTLNTVSHKVMVAPGTLAEPSDLFIAGNDAPAKKAVAACLAELGWGAPIDLGGIAAARGMEAWLLLWTRMMGPLGGDGMFNIRVVRAGT